MVQERARGGDDVHVLAVAHDVELIQRLVRRFRLAFGGAESREIVLAEQLLRGAMHLVRIERPRHAPGMTEIEREIGAAVDDAIKIVALDRREPRLEIVGDLTSALSTPTGCGRKWAFMASRT